MTNKNWRAELDAMNEVMRKKPNQSDTKIIANTAKGNDPKFKEKMQDIYKEIGFSEKMSEINKENWKDPEFRAKQIAKKIINGAKPERKAQVSAQFKGVPKSEEHRNNIRDATLAFNQTEEGKKALAAKAELLRGIPRKKVTCPHCGLEGGEGIMHRHHFDACWLKDNVVVCMQGKKKTIHRTVKSIEETGFSIIQVKAWIATGRENKGRTWKLQPK
jgi:hypothetical protein